MRLLLPIVPVLLAQALPAQVARDEWLISTFNDFIGNTATGALWHVDATRTTVTRLAGQTPNTAGANCVAIDDRGVAYYGTLQSASVLIPNPGTILEVVIAGGSILAETPLTQGPIDRGSVSGIVLVRDRIWFVTDAGNVGWIPKAGGAPTIVLNLQTQGVLGLGQSITSNGREVFIGTSHSAATPDIANVWEIDGDDPAPVLRPLLFLNGSAFALSMARDGKVLAGRISGQMWLIDPLTATGSQINGGAPAPQSNCNGTFYNPWLDVVGNVPGYGSTGRIIGFYDPTTNSWPQQLTMDTSVPSGVASSQEDPFLAFGAGCPGANQLEPRIGWAGMAMQGQNFTLTLRNGDPNGVGILFLGMSNTTGALGPLPGDMTVIGAPGCFELVALDASFAHLVDGNGNASQGLSLPVNPVFAGWQLYAQWAVASTVNQLGLVVSDAVHFRMR